MSRSIHTTGKSILKLAARKFKDDEAKTDALRKALLKLERKGRIKRQVRKERRQEAPPAGSVAVSSIPIEIYNKGPFVHYPASVEDYRALLKILPPASTEGIAKLQLALGKEYIEECCCEEYEERDPFTGRISIELFPGIYVGPCLGVYASRRGVVTIHAYVYDPSRLPFPKNACALYLRLQALNTLVHEIAHHHDQVVRVRRGRWLADRKENSEWYAEKMEHQWTRQYVLPYLEKQYPAEVKELLDWVEQHGGIRLPLEFFAGDNRITERGGLVRSIFSTSGAFECWVQELADCADAIAARLAFAWELHYADKYQECLQVLDGILQDVPEHLDAMTCKADTLIHLERTEEAFALIEHVLARDAANSKAWRVRGDIFLQRKEWNSVLENCEQWERAIPKEHDGHLEIFWQRAVAYCGLGDMKQMEVWVEAWANFGGAKRKADTIRPFVFGRAGRDFPQNEKSSST